MKSHNNLTKIKKFVPSKKMGQNFLIDENIAKQIVDLTHHTQYDLIIEIGPGTGILTQYLIQTNHTVIAVELDKRLCALLKTKFKQYHNLEVINNDILKIDLAQLSGGYKKILLISNLPYSISTPMMLHFLKQNKIDIFYCMLQKELVDRLIASPGQREYSSISVLMHFYTTITRLLDVRPQSFMPPPKVDSNVVVINKKKLIFNEGWSKFIRKCFTFKRKKLLNNLKQDFTLPKIKDLLKRENINENTRAEQLSVEQLFRLYEGLNR